MQRQQALLAWTQSSLDDPGCYVKPASSDASFRSYWRAFSKSQTYIVMDAPPEYENCNPFIDVAKRFNEAGVHAPKILKQDLQQGFLLLTDLGTRLYLDELNEGNALQMYNDAIATLHNIQNRANSADLPAYDESLLQIELNLFHDWFIQRHLGQSLTETQQQALKNCENILIKNALQQPQVFVHRDYHSRNLMFCPGNNPGVIDFQDAVLGPVSYDLVSLLRDCYISWDNEMIYSLLESFRQKFNSQHKTDFDSQQWQRWFDLMGMQRHMKAIGIFSRLNYRDKKPGYLKDIPLTLNYLKSVAESYPEFSEFRSLLEDISPNIDSLCKP